MLNGAFLHRCHDLVLADECIADEAPEADREGDAAIAILGAALPGICVRQGLVMLPDSILLEGQTRIRLVDKTAASTHR